MEHVDTVLYGLWIAVIFGGLYCLPACPPSIISLIPPLNLACAALFQPFPVPRLPCLTLPWAFVDLLRPSAFVRVGGCKSVGWVGFVVEEPSRVYSSRRPKCPASAPLAQHGNNFYDFRSLIRTPAPSMEKYSVYPS